MNKIIKSLLLVCFASLNLAAKETNFLEYLGQSSVFTTNYLITNNIFGDNKVEECPICVRLKNNTNGYYLWIVGDHDKTDSSHKRIPFQDATERWFITNVYKVQGLEFNWLGKTRNLYETNLISSITNLQTLNWTSQTKLHIEDYSGPIHEYYYLKNGDKIEIGDEQQVDYDDWRKVSFYKINTRFFDDLDKAIRRRKTVYPNIKTEAN